jgi:predicted dehydrogenase
MKKIKIAVIGYGVMGKNHCRVINKHPDAVLVAVCDTLRPVIFDYDCPFFNTPTQLLEELEIDVVIIATPPHTHLELAQIFIQSKIPLLIEKPLTSNVEDASYLISILDNNSKVCVGHLERFNPVILALMENLKNREIYSFHLTRIGPFPPRIADVGVLIDLGVHDVDLIRFLSKREIIDHKIFSSKKVHSTHEDNAVLSFQLDGEMVASITTNWLTPFKKRTVEVSTKESYFEANLITQELIEYSDFEINNSYRIRHCYVAKQEPLYLQLTAFIKYVRTGDIGNLASIEDGKRALKYCHNSS